MADKEKKTKAEGKAPKGARRDASERARGRSDRRAAHPTTDERRGERPKEKTKREGAPKDARASALPSSVGEHSAKRPSRRGAHDPSQKRGARPEARASAPTKRDSSAKKGKRQSRIPHAKLRVIPLGGLQEVGKNITLFEYGEDIIVVDCGMGFPDEDMLGIDLVIPDFTYLEKNAHRVKAILLTHGHEDHIGGVPYLLRTVDVPVYGTGLTIGILRNKLEEFKLPKKADLRVVEAGDIVPLGAFSVEFIHVNHSIADSCALAIETPVGMVVHTGDFKLDVSPIDGKMMDLTRLGQIGNAGVELLLSESTNAERPGFTPSERKVGGSFEQLFSTYEENRLLIATFSSNVHRLQQVIDAAKRHGRRVCVIGRSMVNVVAAARELGYMDVPDDLLIDISDLKKYPPSKVVLVMTGSQGEPMSALYRVSFGEHDKVKLSPGDVVILSATAIPGNEKLVGKIVNALVKNGVKVINDNSISVHVSGHACQEELKLMQALIRPKYFMPIHGEYRHLYANKDLAEYMGIPSDRIFIAELGKVLELDGEEASWGEAVPAGPVLIDGSGVGDVGSVVLRDRKSLAQDGLVVVVATVDIESHLLLSGPDIVSRGFVYVRESEELMEEARRRAHDTLQDLLRRGVDDWAQLKAALKDSLSRFLLSRTRRKPMILPVLMEL